MAFSWINTLRQANLGSLSTHTGQRRLLIKRDLPPGSQTNALQTISVVKKKIRISKKHTWPQLVQFWPLCHCSCHITMLRKMFTSLEKCWIKKWGKIFTCTYLRFGCFDPFEFDIQERSSHKSTTSQQEPTALVCVFYSWFKYSPKETDANAFCSNIPINNDTWVRGDRKHLHRM